MSDELYEELKHKMDLQLYDQQPYVRMSAALTMGRLQDDPQEVSDDTFSVTSHLIQVMQHDPSAEVRRAVLVNLDPTKFTISKMLERALDTNFVNRRLVYSRVMSMIGDFRFIKIKHREKLLKWGLKDRDVSVRKAASKMLLEQWLTNVEGNVLEILVRIDVMNSVDVAEIAMDVILANKPELVESLTLTDEQWYNLTPELAFLIRVINNFYLKQKKTALLEKLLPELSGLCTALEHYITQLSEIENELFNQDYDEEDERFKQQTELEFIIEQLLSIAETYDFGDEIGRRKILGVIRESIANLKFSAPQLFSKSVSIIRKLSVKESDFSQVIVELVSDMFDRTEESVEGMEENIKQAMTLGCYTRCLCLLQSTLELINLPLERNQYLSSVLTSLVSPSVQSIHEDVRVGGLKCLALYCLISRKVAAENLELFGKAFMVGDLGIKEIALKAITDMLLVHGKSLVEEENCNVDMRSLYKVYYKALGTAEDDEDEDDDKNDEDKQLQAVACFALCKLMVNGIFDDPLILKIAVLIYFRNQSSSNARLCQQLSYCLPVFCFSSAEHQKLMAEIAIDSLRRLVGTYLDLPANSLDMLNPTQIAAQLIDWTNPAKVLVKSRETGEIENNGGYPDTHANLAISMLDRLIISKSRSRDECKALCLSFGKLNITAAVGVDKLEDILDKIETVFKRRLVSEAMLKNSLARFQKEMQSQLEKAQEDARETGKTDASNVSTETAQSPSEAEEEEEEEEQEDEELADAEEAEEAAESGAAAPEASASVKTQDPVEEVVTSDDDDDEVEEEEDSDEDYGA